MKMWIQILRVLVCLLVPGLLLTFYIDQKNQVTQLRLTIPKVEKELGKVQEENGYLLFSIQNFENPAHLLHLLEKPEFSHLKFPHSGEVGIVEREGRGEN